MAALRGIEFLRRASEILRETPRPTGERLVEGLHAFWTACLDHSHWPQLFQKRAEEIRRLLFAGGTIGETAAEMDEATFAELKEKVCSFAWDAEASCRTDN